MILDAIDQDVLRRHLAEQRRLVARIPDPARAADLLPWPRVEDLVSTDAVPQGQFEMVLNGYIVRPELYRSAPSQALNTAAIGALISQGVTIVVNHIDRLAPEIGSLAMSIGEQTGRRVNANAYITYGSKPGLRRHADPHDVLVVQIHGSKQWLGYGMAGQECSNPLQDNSSGPALWDMTLAQGDMLYLPTGDIHSAIALECPSVHLTFGLHPDRASAA